MSQRILHITLNTGRMTVQRPAAIHANTLQVLRPRVVRLLNSPPDERKKWLGLPDPFFPFELTSKEDVYGPLFLVRWGGEKNPLARFAVGTDRAADAGLWELIHQLGRGELPRRPVTHPLYRPRAPWCATVRHPGRRPLDAATAAQHHGRTGHRVSCEVFYTVAWKAAVEPGLPPFPQESRK